MQEVLASAFLQEDLNDTKIFQNSKHHKTLMEHLKKVQKDERSMFPNTHDVFEVLMNKFKVSSTVACRVCGLHEMEGTFHTRLADEIHHIKKRKLQSAIDDMINNKDAKVMAANAASEKAKEAQATPRSNASSSPRKLIESARSMISRLSSGRTPRAKEAEKAKDHNEEIFNINRSELEKRVEGYLGIHSLTSRWEAESNKIFQTQVRRAVSTYLHQIVTEQETQDEKGKEFNCMGGGGDVDLGLDMSSCVIN